MSEMIQRVATAILEAENPDASDLYTDMARAAIEAMLEPTHKMEDAFYNEPYTNAGSKWRAMVGAALGHFH